MLPAARARGLDPLVLPDLGRELSLRHDARTLARLVREFRRWRPDIVETHTAKAGALGRVAALLSGVPVRLHVFHGHVFHSYFGPAKTRAFLAVEQALARISTRIVALGDVQRAELLAYGVGAPHQVLSIPLGFELAPYLATDSRRGRLRAELGSRGVDARTPLVGIVGRLAPIKAHEVLLQAAAELRRQVPAAQFVVVGDGERRLELERLAAGLGLGQTIHFLGWRSDLAAIYADLDVLALTSDNEGMPTTIIEAMASAVPVVATDVGGVRSLVADGETGLLVPRRDAAAVAAACARLLSDAALRWRMGRAARAAAYPRYDIATLLNTMSTLYANLARRPGPAGFVQ
jgi:glycosyltransferase involved in cell wall biosynthesis